MGEVTGISWTDHTFNPWMGCTKVSPACDHCYAEALMDTRWGKVKWGAGQPRVRTSAANWREPLKWNRAAAAAGVRRRVFCASLADVFDAEVPDAWRDELFALIQRTPHLDWLLLTKRPQVAWKYFEPYRIKGPPSNVWLGTTVESQAMAELRVRQLLRIPATVRFVSYEPALERIDWDKVYLGAPSADWIDWIIVGGESGAGARPMDLQWARDTMDHCQVSGAAFFMKQLGGHPDKRDRLDAFPEALRRREFPRSAA